MGKAFLVDGTTKRTVIDMAECLLTPGEINLGWNDIRNVLLENGETLIAFGFGIGHDRAVEACDDAISNYCAASKTTTRATKVLVNITGPSDLLLKEVNDVLNIVRESAFPAAEVVFGVARDSNLHNQARVSILATAAEDGNA